MIPVNHITGPVNEYQIIIPEELVLSKIYLIRGEKVMLDSDLAQFYEVETKYLKRQVRRNIRRFPDDFMFEMSKQENQINLRLPQTVDQTARQATGTNRLLSPKTELESRCLVSQRKTIVE